MSKTLANLRTKTRTYLDEVTQADFKDTEVDTAINEFYMKTVSSVIIVYEDYYSVKYQTASVADQQEYSLPTDFWKMRRVEVNYYPNNTNSTPNRALPISIDEIRGRLSNTNVSNSPYRNPVYYLRGDLIGFIPIPAESGSEMITIWYIKFISEMANASDEVNIPYPDRFAPAIALGAAGSILRKGQIEEKAAQRYLLDFDAQLERMQAELKERTADDVRGVVDVIGENLDFGQPF